MQQPLDFHRSRGYSIGMKVLFLAKDHTDLGHLESYRDAGDDLTVVSCVDAHLDFFAYKGYNVIDSKEFFALVGMKFDVIIGNPPYGKNCNLPPEFLNKCSELSDDIRLIIPRTMRKASIINRLSSNLHLVSDETLPDDTFRDNIKTCFQHWVVSSEERDQIKEFTKNDTNDFEFLKSSKGSDLIIVRVGNAGVVVPNTEDMVLTTPYHERSPNTTYFIKTKSQDVTNRLVSLQDKFIESAADTVNLNSLSIHDLIRIYLDR